MNLLKTFKNLKLEHIKEYVSLETPEDLFLEFKTANFPHKTEFDLKNIAKCISGFANSTGGIVVWGISTSENKHGVDAASKHKPIKEYYKFLNYLQRNEGKATTPSVSGIQYKRIKDRSNGGYIAMYIPSSENAPHMAQFGEKHYFKRSGDSFYQCEHFDIVDMLNRKTSPKLKIELSKESLNEQKSGDRTQFRYSTLLKLSNIGKAVAKHINVFICINHPYNVAHYGIDGNSNLVLKRIKHDNELFYNAGSELVIHPETSIIIDKIVLNDHITAFAIENLTIKYRVYAENMSIYSGVIRRSKSEILNLLR